MRRCCCIGPWLATTGTTGGLFFCPSASVKNKAASSGVNGWEHFSFVGSRWQNIRKAERQVYLKNAYRVLLTRARQGMVIVVPEGNSGDPTRLPQFYDPTYEYLLSLGFDQICS